MSTAVLVQRAPGDELVRLTAELYELVRSAELVNYSREDFHAQYDKLRTWATDLAIRLDNSRIQATGDAARTIDATVENLRAFGRELADKPRAQELRKRWKSLTHDYEAILSQIRRRRLKVPKDLRLGHIKPRNYARNIFHLANGLVCVLLYELVFDRSMLLLIGSLTLSTFLSMDLLRRLIPGLSEAWVKGVFGTISRPGEAHRIPAATWFLGALLLGVIVLPQHAIELGAVVLAVGDPAASLIGKRWGKRKLVGEKSVAGTLAFAVSAAAASMVFLLLVRPTMALGEMALVGGLAALAGAIAEVSCERFDDNATVPLLAGGVAALLLL